MRHLCQVLSTFLCIVLIFLGDHVSTWSRMHALCAENVHAKYVLPRPCAPLKSAALPAGFQSAFFGASFSFLCRLRCVTSPLVLVLCGPCAPALVLSEAAGLKRLSLSRASALRAHLGRHTLLQQKNILEEFLQLLHWWKHGTILKKSFSVANLTNGQQTFDYYIKYSIRLAKNCSFHLDLNALAECSQ